MELVLIVEMTFKLKGRLMTELVLIVKVTFKHTVRVRNLTSWRLDRWLNGRENHGGPNCSQLWS